MFASKLEFLQYLTDRIVYDDKKIDSTDVLENVISFFQAQTGAIHLFNSNDQLLLWAAHPEELYKTPLTAEFMKYLVNLQQVILLPDIVNSAEKWQVGAAQKGYGAAAFVPLVKQQKIIGYLLLSWKGSHTFKSNDENLLYTVGNLLGLGIFNSQLIAGLQLREEELETMYRALIKAKEAEAKRISRELHDEVGQDLTTIILRLKMILGQGDVADIHDDVKELLSMTRETLTDVQRIAMNLRPSALDSLGLLPAIHWQLEQFRADNQWKIVFNHPDHLSNLGEEHELLLYRVLMEILTNVARHAYASQVVIDIGWENDQLVLRVEDNGIGISLSGTHTLGLGLMGMKERVKEYQGTFLLDSKVGKGTRVTVKVPV